MGDTFTISEIEELLLSHNAKCYSCGVPHKKGEITNVNHMGGFEVKGFDEKQWVYMTCGSCGAQGAIWKILIGLQDEFPKNKENEILNKLKGN